MKKMGFGDGELTMSERMNENHLTDAEKVIFLKGYEAWNECCRDLIWNSLFNTLPSSYTVQLEAAQYQYNDKIDTQVALLLKDKITIGEYMSKAFELAIEHSSKLQEIAAAWEHSINEEHKREVENDSRRIEKLLFR